MKTATVRELRNRYTTVMRWLDAGEPVAISRRGRIVAHLMPAEPAAADRVDWTESPAVRRPRPLQPRLSATQAARVLRDSRE